MNIIFIDIRESRDEVVFKGHVQNVLNCGPLPHFVQGVDVGGHMLPTEHPSYSGLQRLPNSRYLE